VCLIYLLEDDASFGERVLNLLSGGGYEVQWFKRPHDLLYQVGKLPPRVVIVDWILPELSGIEVVRRLRHLLGNSVGALMLTGLDSEDHVLQALSAGADDYVVKPSSEAMLLARVQTLVRRLSTNNQSPPQIIESNGYRFEFASRHAWLNGQPIELAPREFDLAWLLFSNPGRLFTKQELLALIWGKGSSLGYHTISQHVYSLRKKLDLSAHGIQLLSVYASGYRLEFAAS
jgi:DNA-binding response OmpR family regulator